MPKIDWRPGSGRRGRPLRRVLGMGQRQGLFLLSGLAAVMALLAVIAALGGFDGDRQPVAGASAGLGTDPNADKAAADGSGGDNGDGAKGAAKAAELLQASVQHYTDLLATGQQIVGTTHYAGVAAYSQAFADPKSPAALFSKFRSSPNPEADSTYMTVVGKAAAAYDGKPGTLNQWSRDMAKAKWDLADWVATASRYQQGTAAQADLDAAAAKVTQDLAAAKADVTKLG